MKSPIKSPARGARRTLSEIQSDVKKQQVDAVQNAIKIVQDRKKVRTQRQARVPSSSEVSEVSEMEESNEEDSSPESDVSEDVQGGAAAKKSGGTSQKSKKFKGEELKVLLKMCFKYYSIIEGNLSSSESGLTREKKDDTWQHITDQINRYLQLAKCIGTAKIFLRLIEKCES